MIAEMDLDFEPERYKHYYLREIPERFQPPIGSPRTE